MAAESPQDAAELFLRPLRRALSCITNEYLGGGYHPSRPTLLSFPNARNDGYIRLRSDHCQLQTQRLIEFRLSYNYEITEGADGWVAHTTGYNYAFQLDNGREIVAYHFDPRRRWKVQTPHLHVRGLAAPLALSRAHFPTGRVSIEEVIRFAITELRVRPLLPDNLWQALLEETERAFISNPPP